MKKFLSTIVVVVTVFAFNAFADGPPPPPCADGHMHLPGIICTPPDHNRSGENNQNTPDDSTLTYIQTLIAEYNPFVFFIE